MDSKISLTPISLEKSRTIAGIGWEDGVLYVHFYKTGFYKYCGVTLGEKNQIENAPSPGKELHSLLKDRLYKRLKEDDTEFKRLKYNS